MSEAKFTDTSGELARQSGVIQPTIQKYANLGLLDYVTASNGTKLFRAGQAQKVRDILAQRMATRRRGRRAAAQ